MRLHINSLKFNLVKTQKSAGVCNCYQHRYCLLCANKLCATTV